MTTRHAAARAFIAQELKKGRAWSTLSYAYERKDDNGMSYFVWLDLDPKRSDAAKVAAAIARYVERFGAPPATVLTHADRPTIAPGALWLGPVEDAT